MADTDAYDIAADLLDSIETRFAAAGVGLPERRYVHAGEVADEVERCDQLVVSLQRINSGLPGWAGRGEIRPEHVLTAEYEVRLTRCVPVVRSDGTPPSIDQLNGSALEILTDATVLPRALLGAVREGDLGECRSVGLSGLVPIGPTGGIGGVSMMVGVDLT